MSVLPSFQFPLCSQVPGVTTGGCSGPPAKYLPIADTWYRPRPVILSGFCHIPEICPVSLDPMIVLEFPAPAEWWWLRIACLSHSLSLRDFLLCPQTHGSLPS